MVNVFFARLTFPFSMQLLPISSFGLLFLLKAVTGSSWNNLEDYIPVFSNSVANIWQKTVIG